MKEIKIYLKQEFDEFQQVFNDAVHSQVSLLDKIMKYVVRSKGKQLRPMFVMLSAKICGDINQTTYRAASLIELLHTATLVHDDVVDEADERRGFFSLNALWKNKIAVLVGDYLLSKGLLLSLGNKDFHILEILAQAVKEMSEGELLQIEKARKLDITEDVYFNIIKFKTASLIASACAAGAYSAQQNEDLANKMALFGEKAGMAFQIKDDLFDYGTDNVGKPTGNDIREKKMTLPLIYTLNTCSPAIKRSIISIFKKKKNTKEDVQYVIEQVTQHGGIAYAEQTMNRFVSEALEILNTFTPGEAKNHMERLINYTVLRKK